MSPEDDLMREALSLADRGRFEVEPNPRVGCLLLKDGEVVDRMVGNPGSKGKIKEFIAKHA